MRFLILAVMFLQSFCYANESRPRLFFSSLDHVRVSETYLPLITQVYDELGFDIEIVDMLDERASISIANNLIDGAVLKGQAVIDRYPEMIKVEPQVTRAALYLFCQLEVRCDLAVLQDKKISIGITVGFNRNWGNEFNAQLATFGTFEDLKLVFIRKRLNYILYPDEVAKTQPWQENFNSINFKESGVYHVLAPKHKLLATKVSPVLAKKLAQLTGNPNSKTKS